MKYVASFLLLLALMLPTSVGAQTTVSQGGTGTTTLPVGSFWIGSTTVRAVNTGSRMVFDYVTGVLTLSNKLVVPFASTTALSVSGLTPGNCVQAGTGGLLTTVGSPCGSSSGGSGTVSTSSSETATYVPFWTSTNGTPALLSGGDSGFTWNNTAKRLTATYASSTGISASYASSTSGFFGSATIGTLSGILKATAGLVSVATVGVDYQAAGNYITALTGDVTATGPGSVAATLATVNGNVGSFTNANITVNGKGLITAASNGSASGANAFEIATTSTIAVPQVAYFTQASGRTTLGGVATTTFTPSAAFTVGGTIGTFVGGTNSTIDIANNGVALGKLAQIAANTVLGNPTGATANVQAFSTSSLFAGTAGQVLAKTSAGTWIGVATTTAGTGLTYTGTAFNVNTSQNISTLSNLTSNGFVRTSGGTGALSVQTDPCTVAQGCTGAVTFTNDRVLTGNGTSAIVDEANMTFDGNTLTVTGSGLNNTVRVIGTNTTSSGLYFQNTQTTGQAVMYVDNDRGSFAAYGGLLDGGSANVTGNIFGVSRADKVFLFSDGASSLGLGVGTLTAQPLIFGTNNLERIRVLSGGNVGIGTTSPYATLSVVGPVVAEYFYGTSTTAKSIFGGVTPQEKVEKSFSYSTTTWTGTTTIPLGPAYSAQTWLGVKCFTDAGTLGVSFYDGTNRMNYIPTASTTVNLNAFTTNNLFTSSEKRYVDIGTPATSPKQISCTVNYEQNN